MPLPRPAGNGPGGPPRQSLVHRAIFWTGIVAAAVSGVLLVVSIAFVVALYRFAPNVSEPDLYALNRPPSLTFADENDHPAGQRGASVGERLTLSQLPAYVPQAFIAEEDRRFYQHRGIDPQGMLRAAIVNLHAGHVVQGGSTITQQLVKMLFLTPDRTWTRKLHEMGGALALERRLTKQQILELYLNRVYLGSGAYGIDAAAHVYFGDSARNLTVAQAAMLAALTRAPSVFSPRRDLEAAQNRARQVLAQMVQIGAITPQQARLSESHPAVVAAPNDDFPRNYFLDAAAVEVRQLVPNARGDLIVSTTLDPKLESAAWSQLASALNRRGRALHVTQGAVVSMTIDGAVRALVGGRDYAESAFNRVTSAHRQPGSAFKAFVYLAAFEKGLTPATVRVDQPVTIQNFSKVWTPDNYSQFYLGPVTLEEAFMKSINTVAVQLGQEVGIPTVVNVAHQLGIASPLNPVPSLAIGTSDVTPLEITAAYGAFATLGHKVEPYLVREIRTPDGRVLYRRPPSASPLVFSNENALDMNDLLYQVVHEGTGHAAAVPGHEVAGKTGTSSDYRDAWFIGFSPDLITGVWVGNDDSSPMNRVTGGLLPAQIWGRFMRVALQNQPDTPIQRAEPVMPMIAQTPATGAATGEPGMPSPEPGPFDGLGRFFGGLFGYYPPPTPPPQQSAEIPPDFYTRRLPDPAATIPNDNTTNNSSSGGSMSGNTRADPQTQGGPPDGDAPPYGYSPPPPALNRATPPVYPSIAPGIAAPPPDISTPNPPNYNTGPIGQNQIPSDTPAPDSPNSPAGPLGQNQLPPDLSQPSANSPTEQPQGNANPSSATPDQPPDSSGAQQSGANPDSNPG